MIRPLFDDAVQLCVARDPRYTAEAYAFVRDALDVTMKLITDGNPNSRRHVSGQELCDGARLHALEQFGPMARLLLGGWGVRDTADIGHIVFNLIETEVFSRSTEDRQEDFVGVFDFAEAFDQPFLPPSRRQTPASPAAQPARPVSA